MSLYKELSDALLAGFFIEINKNIDKGILSAAMYHEINLIMIEMKRQNLVETDLKRIYLESIQSLYKNTH
ncbi:hypothetical protein [Bacillus anthracis]|uniref:hypothetical protein n=1 Tax=Bacillus anthracis TaxID=1392 RepID=UPI00099CB885|nr:hypothetical protein [Bacillus anthracis]OPD52638.1 hypothetical protein BVG01_30460 [Bacillus anthracis]